MLYSFLVTKQEQKKSEALKALQQSMDKSYELYHYLLLLPIALTHLQEQRLDNAKNKYLPTDEDLNPNTKLIDNLLVRKLEANVQFNEYLKANPISWNDSEVFLRLILDKILNSDIYQEYINSSNNHLNEDCAFWRDILRKLVFIDDDFAEVLENKSVFWNDDLETIGTFVLKTIKKFEDSDYDSLLPQFKDAEDQNYGALLFTNVVDNIEEYRNLIEQFVDKESWDMDRLAFMDVVVLMTAIAELLNVPSVPTQVTMNEYIEIAKYYSTNKSGRFVNGILIAIINHLKTTGRIVKE